MAQTVPSLSQGSIVLVEQQPRESSVVKITLKKKNNKTVRWHEDVIDNEFLNKKKSKSTCSSVVSLKTKHIRSFPQIFFLRIFHMDFSISLIF
jgi:hypothetical protein